ncbi:MAG: AcvB/VirJ family lysyl-phosphatidylglycerol hydrolase [Acidobacteriota bacterium]
MSWALTALMAFLLSSSSLQGTVHAQSAPLDLPLVELPATSSSTGDLVILYSGDGGWATIDRSIATSLASKGMAVVGVNSLQYFWKARTPDGASHDLERLLRYYLQSWGSERIILVGYSRGADVLPFLITRLPPDLLARVRLIALLGPGTRVQFEFHVSDWLSDSGSGMPIAPELEKLRGRRMDCFFGIEEKDSLCKVVDDRLVKKIELRGKHHFGGDYTFLADSIRSDARAAQ